MSQASRFTCATPRWLLLASLAASVGTLHAQAVGAPSPSLELPVLVVDHEHRPVDDFTADKFRVRAGVNPAFAPISVRKEGDAPISLSIVIDASRDSFHDLHELGDALAAIAPASLHPNDTVSVYAFDCAMTRSLLNAPPEPTVLRKAIGDAMSAPGLHGNKSSSACGKTVHLWDDVAIAVTALSKLPGRHVLILVTSGKDGGSKYNWRAIQGYAFQQTVAIFGFRDKRQADIDDRETMHHSPMKYNSPGRGTIVSLSPSDSLNDLDLLCINSGGLSITVSPVFRERKLANILGMVRDRLSSQFQLANLPPDTPGLKVTVAANSYFVSAGGPSKPKP